MGPEGYGPRGRTLWDTLAEVLVSPSAIIIAALILLIILVIAILVRTGHLSFSMKGVKVGRTANPLAERYVLKRQIEWVEHFLLSLVPKIHKMLTEHPDGVSDDYKREPEFYIKWLLSRLCSYITIHWLVLNNLDMDKKRIDAKIDEFMTFLGALTNNDSYDDNVFRENIEGWAEEVIKNAIRIRQEYEGHV